MQFEAEPAPATAEYVPALQFVHTPEFTIAMPVPYIPAEQAVQADSPVLEPYVPAVQFRQA